MQIIRKLVLRIYKKALKKSTLEVYHGISICDANMDDKDDDDFLQWTKNAIDMIKNNSRKHYMRLKREIDCVVNIEGMSAGEYRKELKTCLIDFSKYNFQDKDSEWYFNRFVMTLIHEATHGYLESKGIRYVPRNRITVEKICIRESVSFIKKLNPSNCDQLIESSKFSIDAYSRHWNLTRWDRLKASFSRMLKVKFSGGGNG